MRILIVKTSSLGDIIHTLPALTDLAAHCPESKVDWLVEESFVEIPRWHPHIKEVIPVAWRRWRKNLFSAWQQKELQTFYHQLRQKKYDYIIDAQGLLKSALMSCLARGARYGFGYKGAREPWVASLYQHRFEIPQGQHMLLRIRELFAQTLKYSSPTSLIDYDIKPYFKPNSIFRNNSKNILFIHGTTRATKEWPTSNWIELAKRCVEAGYTVQLPWGNTTEKNRAGKIAANIPSLEALPKTSLTELAGILLNAKAAVAVDTGIGHLAAALNIPTLSLYGPTDPMRIGTMGSFQTHLRQSNQMADLSVERVWEALQTHILIQ